jgi:tetratricopeptide (TPR) repeat protein
VKKSYYPKEIIRTGLILLLLSALILIPRPILGELYLVKAFGFEKAEKYAQAGLAFNSAAERIPWFPSLWEKAGEAYLQAQDYDRSETAYARAQEKHALSLNGSMHWGDAAFARGDTSFAVNLWNELLRKGGNQANLLQRLARGYETLNKTPEEIKSWREYLTYHPTDAAAQYRLGLLLTAVSPGEASPYLIQAAQLEPSLDASVQNLRSALNMAFL